MNYVKNNIFTKQNKTDYKYFNKNKFMKNNIDNKFRTSNESFGDTQLKLNKNCSSYLKSEVIFNNKRIRLESIEKVLLTL